MHIGTDWVNVGEMELPEWPHVWRMKFCFRFSAVVKLPYCRKRYTMDMSATPLNSIDRRITERCIESYRIRRVVYSFIYFHLISISISYINKMANSRYFVGPIAVLTVLANFAPIHGKALPKSKIIFRTHHTLEIRCKMFKVTR